MSDRFGGSLVRWACLAWLCQCAVASGSLSQPCLGITHAQDALDAINEAHGRTICLNFSNERYGPFDTTMTLFFACRGG